MKKSIKTILVDLTPILPGGENGGAKIFVLELLKLLANNHQQTQFILLTQEKSHDELQFLDTHNMSRVLIEKAAGKKSFFARMVGFILRLIPFIPHKISLIGYRLYAKLRARSIQSMINNIKPDLLFCPFTAPIYHTPNVPTVCVIYDLQYKSHPLFFERADILNRDHAFTEACRLATMLTSISEYSRQSALKHYKKIDQERIKTIHLRIAKRVLKDDAPCKTLLTTLDLTPKKYLIYPANFWLHKNHEMLLTALKIAYHTNILSKEVKLVCTGSPGKRQLWLINAAEKMGLKNQVVFTGYLKDIDIATLLGNSSGVIFPSLYEGFGLPILEAMAMNVPVACSNITSLPEIAQDGAIYFDPRIPEQIAKAMATLYTDKQKSEELIKIGQKRVQEYYDYNKMAAEYWELFQSACALTN